MNNYIGKVDAEWVDPAVELPPEGEWVHTEVGYWDGAIEPMMNFIRCGLWNEGADLIDAEKIFVLRWLRIGGPTDAIPRAQVQAAVDEMKRRYQHGENCINGEDGSCEGCNLYRFQFPHCKSFACIERFTGVTPSEVQ
jgi:hypothetical protein